ncbi:hypothetical protein EDB98_104212 [Pseudomonas fluorescens]|nr:hypothetical protein EDB98_104212 [Pseudomonas fluorescens]SFW38946.1 hypothetical protein SAMN03159439_01669 [Pseudomonas sp. NFACC04-2]
MLPLGSVGAGEACDLLISRLRLERRGKDRSLVALDSSYRSLATKDSYILRNESCPSQVDNT